MSQPGDTTGHVAGTQRLASDVGTMDFDPKRIGDAAKAWGATIAGVLTAGGVVAAIQGDNKLNKASDGSQTLAIIFLIAALVLAVAAIVRAFQAAWEEKATPRSELIGWLKQSIIATVAALVFLVLFALVLLRDDAAQNYLVTFDADKSVICGEIEGSGTALTVVGQPLTGVGSMAAVDDCP